MSERLPADQAQRDAALDPTRSFIVQAPAGSGKTGLLTQRFLNLLARADDPEEIVAITFTRKAAAEMRGRVLKALRSADGDEPGGAWERRTWRLARAVAERAKSCGWNLQENPQRLRIRTIDSLCQYIARQMPLRSGFGEPPGVAEDAQPLYEAAALSVLAELETNTPLASDLARLLEAVDNRIDTLQRLIASMLARRDQWLWHIVSGDDRAEVERALQAAVVAHLERLHAVFPTEWAGELVSLARYAADNLDAGHALACLAGLEGLPGTTAADLPAWRALAGLLLSGKGEWRKAVNVSIGFPPGSGVAGERKSQMGDLLQALASLPEETGLREMLDGVRMLPPVRYPDGEWVLIEALFSVLRAAVAHLKVVFSERGEADFGETALAAQEALGNDLQPSDLALRLDYRIQHLLVDEFQDTSRSQYRLFQRLTAGWQPGDGRTLFLVGDPMQSIYGFREAEVGLFLDAWQGRLGDIELVPLRLEVNFRSQRGVVDWVNANFPRVLPSESDKQTGAVACAPSTAWHEGSGGTVRVHPTLVPDDEAEAENVLAIVRQARSADPDGSTAVLVRSKSRLSALVEVLRRERIRYQAVEIGALGERPAVMDLVSLTVALLHPADRIAWLALLCGPLCGLSRADVHALAGDDRQAQSHTIPELLCDRGRLGRLSADGQARAGRLAATLTGAVQQQGRVPLCHWIEGVWLALGGPATLADETALEDVEVCFRWLQEAESKALPLLPETIRDGVARLFSRPDPQADASLQLMTIHKAKGLEFDTVIVPGLGRTTRGDDRRLLYWLESTDEDGNAALFFGPVRSARQQQDSPVSAWIRRLESTRSELEDGRLLYVAATRARKRLHLLGHARVTSGGDIRPAGGSLLARLWPAIGGLWEELEPPDDPGVVPSGTGSLREPVRSRLAADWACPPPPESAGRPQPGARGRPEGIVYEWAGDTARAVGTVVHRLLQHLSTRPGAEPAALGDAARLLLAQAGVPEAGVEAALSRVTSALNSVLADERGRWLLSGEHRDAHSEFPLTAVLDGELRHMVVDRTFVDDKGIRWVIDYKTGSHEGAGVDHFLDEEADRYRAQLSTYARAFRKLEDRPVRAALYYPLVSGGWREVDAS